VEIIAPFLSPAPREGDRIVGIDGFLRRFALAEADDLAVHEIDGWKNQHGEKFEIRSLKFERSLQRMERIAVVRREN
jgi:hypothetical protein